MNDPIASRPTYPPRRGFIAALAVLGGAGAWLAWSTVAADSAAVAIAPPLDAGAPAASAAAAADTAVLAGGCLWGVQGVFQQVRGVSRAVSGYAGGDAATATYSAIGTGRTGHAEAVRIGYDPKVVSFGQLLQIFFSVVHDPTQLNRQGPDSGTQYRSTVFAQNAEQARIAHAYIAQLDKARSFGRPIATTVELNKPFYDAEPYHQDYLALHPTQPYIAVHDLPKVENLKRLYPDRWRAQPVLVGASS